MITPTRFGLKYAPVPTLALEYEVELSSIDDGGGATSLYVYDHKNAAASHTQRVKKLHVVELPALTRQSELAVVARQLQQDNRRFLAPDIVKEDQLLRLLERLIAHAQASELSVSPSLLEGSGSELEESALDKSIAEASASMDASNRSEGDVNGDDDEKSGGGSAFKVVAAAETRSSSPTGGLNASEDSREMDQVAGPTTTKTSEGEDEAAKREAQGDAAKLAALRNGDASDGEEAVSEEDIQSEELEYFSEDGSDEDSF
ncbi:hypothetical protein PybrP1_004234 [[Pythium] brassicae (nom. inval.)]|nr:hypothetical protein PybrP1_004234 [[Pythium] brassicae (nom. inval.)]